MSETKVSLLQVLLLLIILYLGMRNLVIGSTFLSGLLFFLAICTLTILPTYFRERAEGTYHKGWYLVMIIALAGASPVISYSFGLLLEGYFFRAAFLGMLALGIYLWITIYFGVKKGFWSESDAP
jgi:hypothetical protein